MKILISIIFNALILYIIVFLLGNCDNGTNINYETCKAIGELDKTTCGIIFAGGLKTYIIGGIILGVINVVIKPILKIFAKILTLPFFFLSLGLTSLIVNFVILWLFDKIVNQVLMIEGVCFKIEGIINLVIAVAIFTILNILYSVLFFKK